MSVKGQPRRSAATQAAQRAETRNAPSPLHAHLETFELIDQLLVTEQRLRSRASFHFAALLLGHLVPTLPWILKSSLSPAGRRRRPMPPGPGGLPKRGVNGLPWQLGRVSPWRVCLGRLEPRNAAEDPKKILLNPKPGILSGTKFSKSKTPVGIPAAVADARKTASLGESSRFKQQTAPHQRLTPFFWTVCRKGVQRHFNARLCNVHKLCRESAAAVHGRRPPIRSGIL